MSASSQDPELLPSAETLLGISSDPLPSNPAWDKLSLFLPGPDDKLRAGQWDAKVRLFRYLAKAAKVKPHSYRALCGDLRLFFYWCQERDVASLPAAPETLVAFLKDQAEIKRKNSVKRYLASISKAHQLAHVTNPVRHEEVKLVLDELYEQDVSEPGQAEALRWAHIKVALANMGDRLIDVRDRALVQVAYDILARCSEIPRLTREGISRAGDHYKIQVIRSKKSKKGKLQHKFLSASTVVAVEAWCQRAGISEGYLFRGVAKSGQVLETPLSDAGVSRALQRVAKAAGLDPRGFSGHSCRVGACQDMSIAGMDIHQIMLAGDWDSPDMPAYYARKVAPDKSGMAKLAALQQRS